MYFDVIGVNEKSIKIEELGKIETLKDLNPGYPSSWITEADYISTEISVTSDGHHSSTIGGNEILTQAQRKNIATADIFSDILIEVKYKEKNAATENIDVRTMSFSITVVPNMEARYVGGNSKLSDYLLENAILNISHALAPKFDLAKVKFSIDETGQVQNVSLSQSSENDYVDGLLQKVIKEMPRWHPAETASGIKLSQEFELVVGSAAGC